MKLKIVQFLTYFIRGLPGNIINDKLINTSQTKQRIYNKLSYIIQCNELFEQTVYSECLEQNTIHYTI